MAEPEMVKLGADFAPADGPGDPPPASDYDTAVGKLREAQVQLGNPPDGLRFQRPAASAPKAAWVAWSDKVREAAGVAWQYIDDAVPLLPKGSAPPVQPPVQPPVAQPGLSGSYPGHDPAEDCYLGGPWGPHHGIELRAPCPGRVDPVYSFPTPLSVYDVMDADTVRRHRNLFKGWSCVDPNLRQLHLLAEVTDRLGEDATWVTSAWGPDDVEALQTMRVFVFWPDSPLNIGYAVLARWLGGAHVGVVNAGRVNTGDVMALTSNSGINFEAAGIPEARAAHWHAIAGSTTTLSPNGDLPGRLLPAVLGFPTPTRSPKPGPTDYQQRRADGVCMYCAGRPRSDFNQAGVPIPSPAA